MDLTECLLLDCMNYEGDFGVIMAILEKMENKLNMFVSALSAISRDVFTLKSKSMQGSAGQVTVARSDVNKEEGGQLICQYRTDQIARNSIVYYYSTYSVLYRIVGRPQTPITLAKTGVTKSCSGPNLKISRHNPCSPFLVSYIA